VGGRETEREIEKERERERKRERDREREGGCERVYIHIYKEREGE
jgi:hypothetical protein